MVEGGNARSRAEVKTLRQLRPHDQLIGIAVPIEPALHPAEAGGKRSGRQTDHDRRLLLFPQGDLTDNARNGCGDARNLADFRYKRQGDRHAPPQLVPADIQVSAESDGSVGLSLQSLRETDTGQVGNQYKEEAGQTDQAAEGM